jgi:hypothetical protein
MADRWDEGFRVLALDLLFVQDLEQCADVAYRLFAEYSRGNGREHNIKFKLQNGQPLSWSEWRSGTRLVYDPGKDRHVAKQVAADRSRAAFNDFLKYLFYWSGSWAVLKYADTVDISDLRVGDMIVQNETGGTGHLTIIVDICENQEGEIMYLLANGWTPAQEIVIVKPEGDQGIDYWFTLEGYDRHISQFDFGPFHYRRFQEVAE